MSKKPDRPKIPRIDLPEVSETFADSLGFVMAGNGVFRIELLVSRAHMMNDGAPPVMKKYTAARLVLANEAVIELFNALNNLMAHMEGQGGIVRGPGPNDKLN